MPSFSQLLADVDRLFDAFDRVIGVNQKDTIVGHSGRIVFERGRLVIE